MSRFRAKVGLLAVLCGIGGPLLWLSATRPVDEAAFLRVDITTLDLCGEDISGATVRFTNRGPRPIAVVKPLDGSEWGWVQPHYEFVVTDAHGRRLRLVPRCKQYALPYSDPRWREDFLLTLPPWGVDEIPVIVPVAAEARRTYRVEFRYVCHPRDGWEVAAWAGLDVWRGRAVSPPVVGIAQMPRRDLVPRSAP